MISRLSQSQNIKNRVKIFKFMSENDVDESFFYSGISIIRLSQNIQKLFCVCERVCVYTLQYGILNQSLEQLLLYLSDVYANFFVLF